MEYQIIKIDEPSRIIAISASNKEEACKKAQEKYGGEIENYVAIETTIGYC